MADNLAEFLKGCRSVCDRCHKKPVTRWVKPPDPYALFGVRLCEGCYAIYVDCGPTPPPPGVS